MNQWGMSGGRMTSNNLYATQHAEIWSVRQDARSNSAHTYCAVWKEGTHVGPVFILPVVNKQHQIILTWQKLCKHYTTASLSSSMWTLIIYIKWKGPDHNENHYNQVPSRLYLSSLRSTLLSRAVLHYMTNVDPEVTMITALSTYLLRMN